MAGRTWPARLDELELDRCGSWAPSEARWAVLASTGALGGAQLSACGYRIVMAGELDPRSRDRSPSGQNLSSPDLPPCACWGAPGRRWVRGAAVAILAPGPQPGATRSLGEERARHPLASHSTALTRAEHLRRFIAVSRSGTPSAAPHPVGDLRDALAPGVESRATSIAAPVDERLLLSPKSPMACYGESWLSRYPQREQHYITQAMEVAGADPRPGSAGAAACPRGGASGMDALGGYTAS